MGETGQAGKAQPEWHLVPFASGMGTTSQYSWFSVTHAAHPRSVLRVQLQPQCRANLPRGCVVRLERRRPRRHGNVGEAVLVKHEDEREGRRPRIRRNGRSGRHGRVDWVDRRCHARGWSRPHSRTRTSRFQHWHNLRSVSCAEELRCRGGLRRCCCRRRVRRAVGPRAHFPLCRRRCGMRHAVPSCCLRHGCIVLSTVMSV